LLSIVQNLLLYQWLENCLQLGERLSEDQYRLKLESEEVSYPREVAQVGHLKPANARYSGDESLYHKRNRFSSEGSSAEGGAGDEKMDEPGEFPRLADVDSSRHAEDEVLAIENKPKNICSSHSPSSVDSDSAAPEASEEV